MSQKKIYDLEKVYDEEISPLMQKVIEVCKREGLPMLSTFCYKIESDNTYNFASTCLDRDGFIPGTMVAARIIIQKVPPEQEFIQVRVAPDRDYREEKEGDQPGAK